MLSLGFTNSLIEQDVSLTKDKMSVHGQPGKGSCDGEMTIYVKLKFNV